MSGDTEVTINGAVDDELDVNRDVTMIVLTLTGTYGFKVMCSEDIIH